MADFSIGDVLFILLIFAVIHGLMQVAGSLRRRKAQNRGEIDDA